MYTFDFFRQFVGQFVRDMQYGNGFDVAMVSATQGQI
jgi:hypothetical protein